MLSTFLDPYIHTALMALSAALVTLLVGLVSKLLTKLNLHLDEVQEARVRAYAQQAANYAEEHVEALVKAGVVKAADSQSSKISTAVDQLLQKVPGLGTSEVARQAIESELRGLLLGATSSNAPLVSTPLVSAVAAN